MYTTSVLKQEGPEVYVAQKWMQIKQANHVK
jgi:hypothetical protein